PAYRPQRAPPSVPTRRSSDLPLAQFEDTFAGGGDVAAVDRGQKQLAVLDRSAAGMLEQAAVAELDPGVANEVKLTRTGDQHARFGVVGQIDIEPPVDLEDRRGNRDDSVGILADRQGRARADL